MTDAGRQLRISPISSMAMTRCSIIGLLLLIATFNNVAQAADNKYVPSARKADIKYIKCEVCELLVKQILRQFKAKQEKKAPKKVSEKPCLC